MNLCELFVCASLFFTVAFPSIYGLFSVKKTAEQVYKKICISREELIIRALIEKKLFSEPIFYLNNYKKVLEKRLFETEKILLEKKCSHFSWTFLDGKKLCVEWEENKVFHKAVFDIIAL